jgi:hypothetical protein
MSPEFKPQYHEKKKKKKKRKSEMMIRNLSKRSPSQTLVAHVCNPSYSGGIDQEDRSAVRQIVCETLS